MIVVVYIIGIIILCFLYMLIRNAAVFAFLQDLNKKTYTACKDDIDNDRDPLWRYEVFEDGVSYDYMLFHFWVWPLDRFYPDQCFTKKGARPHAYTPIR